MKKCTGCNEEFHDITTRQEFCDTCIRPAEIEMEIADLHRVIEQLHYYPIEVLTVHLRDFREAMTKLNELVITITE